VVRIVTYNIRHGQGVGGFISLARVAAALRSLQADVIVLNEVYFWPPYFDQPGRLAALTGTTALFQSNVCHGRAEYGNAILSRHPISVHSKIRLPSAGEQRGCLVADLKLAEGPIRVAGTHLALGRDARAAQIEALARELPRELPLILAGDMNSKSRELEPLLVSMREIDPSPQTYPSVWPRVPYDHILFSENWTLGTSGILRTLASDHVPLFADLELG
jgi:endonuclease/exonuclease/phosphatase family metal-dependent hydrolase